MVGVGQTDTQHHWTLGGREQGYCSRLAGSVSSRAEATERRSVDVPTYRIPSSSSR